MGPLRKSRTECGTPPDVDVRMTLLHVSDDVLQVMNPSVMSGTPWHMSLALVI